MNEQKANLIRTANNFCPGMVKRGGGVVGFTVRKIAKSMPKKDYSFHLILHFHIDVCDSMGANCATSVAEGISPYLQNMTNARIGVRIVSNLAPERISTAKFRIPVEKMAYKGVTGKKVAENLIEAYEWALDDPFRAVTHNKVLCIKLKGVMNGIDAVAIATGQDWRAIEASCHAWASIKSAEKNYHSLTRYWIENDSELGEVFCGELELPIPCGTCGGVLKTHPTYKFTMGIMGINSSKELAMSMVCVGLAQNFAALRFKYLILEL